MVVTSEGIQSVLPLTQSSNSSQTCSVKRGSPLSHTPTSPFHYGVRTNTRKFFNDTGKFFKLTPALWGHKEKVAWQPFRDMKKNQVFRRSTWS